MKRSRKIPYEGKSLDLFTSVVTGANYEDYVVYRGNSSGGKVYFYIDGKNFLHIFFIRESSTRRGMYQVSDYRLSSKSKMAYSDRLNIQNKSKDYLVSVLDRLVGKDIRVVNRI